MKNCETQGGIKIDSSGSLREHNEIKLTHEKSLSLTWNDDMTEKRVSEPLD